MNNTRKEILFSGRTHSVPPVTSDPERYTACTLIYFNQIHASHCTHFLVLPLNMWGIVFKHQTWTPASNSDADNLLVLVLCVDSGHSIMSKP